MKKFHLVVAAVLVFAVGSAFTATKFVAEPKANKAAFANTYWVTGKGGSGSTAYFNISTNQSPNCGDGTVEPCKITTNLTLGSTALQSTVNNPAQVTIVEKQQRF